MKHLELWVSLAECPCTCTCTCSETGSAHLIVLTETQYFHIRVHMASSWWDTERLTDPKRSREERRQQCSSQHPPLPLPPRDPHSSTSVFCGRDD